MWEIYSKVAKAEKYCFWHPSLLYELPKGVLAAKAQATAHFPHFTLRREDNNDAPGACPELALPNCPFPNTPPARPSTPGVANLATSRTTSGLRNTGWRPLLHTDSNHTELHAVPQRYLISSLLDFPKPPEKTLPTTPAPPSNTLLFYLANLSIFSSGKPFLTLLN